MNELERQAAKERYKEIDKEKTSPASIAVAIFAIIAILILAILFYYFSLKSMGLTFVESYTLSSALNSTQNIAVDYTDVIPFESPKLPQVTKIGKCWTNSVAQPFRTDAFRCMVGEEIFDPCFSTANADEVFCQMNPLKDESFVIKLTETLPVLTLPDNVQKNWGWFIVLKDGTYCSPFTGTRQVIQGKVAYFGCESKNANERIVLTGYLNPGNIWRADKATLIEKDGGWIIKSLERAEISTVFQ